MITKNSAPALAVQGQKVRGQAQRQDTSYLHQTSVPVKVLGRLMRRLAIWFLRRHLEGHVHGSFDPRVSAALDCLGVLEEVAR